MMHHISFQNPEFLWLFILIPGLIVWYWYRNKAIKPAILFSTTQPFANAPKSIRVRFRHSLFVIRLLILSLIIVAFARPQSSSNRQDVNIEGIDIVMALDISTSMLAEDLKPNRLEAAKKVGMEFIESRPNDRIGLVIFSGEAFTQCPITSDHSIIKNIYESIQSGIIDDGTALGDGLATAVSRLKDSKAISKVIILLTDGVNNAGFVDPATASEIAKTYGIRVYTIGVGKNGVAPYPFDGPFGKVYQNVPVEIDEPLLQKIAANTNAEYYRAKNRSELQEIYKQIDKLEKSKIEVLEYRKKSELFLPLILIAAALLLIEILLRNTIYKSIP